MNNQNVFKISVSEKRNMYHVFIEIEKNYEKYLYFKCTQKVELGMWSKLTKYRQVCFI